MPGGRRTARGRDSEGGAVSVGSLSFAVGVAKVGVALD